jgi:heat shock protein HslJ
MEITMKKLNFSILAGFVLTLLALTACGYAGNAATLPGTAWKLVSYGSTASPTPALPDTVTAFKFGKDGKLGGSAGCNTFGGEYKLNSSQITFGPIASTEMACAPEKMAQESAVLQNLTGTAQLDLVNGNLTITSADGNTRVTLALVSQ